MPWYDKATFDLRSRKVFLPATTQVDEVVVFPEARKMKTSSTGVWRFCLVMLVTMVVGLLIGAGIAVTGHNC